MRPALLIIPARARRAMTNASMASSARPMQAAASTVPIQIRKPMVLHGNRVQRPRLYIFSDLDHTWLGTHRELNFNDPNNALSGTNDGFVRQNDLTEQSDTAGETPTDDDTMGFYTQADLPYYYALAETFAVDDRYFASTQAQTVPNRLYELAGTSFGHLVTSVAESIPPPGGYQPIQGTIFDLLDKRGVDMGRIR
jgi:phospholipase C